VVHRPVVHQLGSALVVALVSACAGSASDGPDAVPELEADGTAATLPGQPGTAGPDGPSSGTSTGAPGPTGTSSPSDAAPLDAAKPGSTDPSATPSPGTAATPAGADECANAALRVGPSVLRRLGRIELQLSLQQLFALDTPPDVAEVPEDPKFQNFRSLGSLQTVSPQHLRAYADVARGLALDLLADPVRRSAVLGCDVNTEGCLEDFTARFGRLAYRRALGADEVSDLTTRATEYAESPEDEFTFVIEALLTSPSFVFRAEVGDTPEGPSTLSSLELAAKLSFSILGRTPDDALLTRGENGEFDTPEGLAAAAEQLLNDPRAEQYFDTFFEQWLDFEEAKPPPMPPEGWSEALLPEMAEETERVLHDFAWGGGDFLGVFSANYTYAGPELAAFESLPGPGGTPATRIDFTPTDPRYGTGILTHGALIAAKGDGDLIAHRGKWFFTTFLCTDLALPVGLLDSLGDELEGLTRTQILAKRNEDTRCSGCHQVIDPVGVGFAQYDSGGRFDDSVSLADFPVSPALAGSDPGQFSSIAELARLLAGRSEVPACLGKRVFLYTQGREPESADACAQQRVADAFDQGQHDFRQLLLAMVTAPEFRLRTPAPVTE
jgi:hypothetical protein